MVGGSPCPVQLEEVCKTVHTVFIILLLDCICCVAAQML